MANARTSLATLEVEAAAAEVAGSAAEAGDWKLAVAAVKVVPTIAKVLMENVTKITKFS